MLPAAVVATRFETRTCTACRPSAAAQPGSITVDGRGHGVLRSSDSLAFGLEVFYQFAHRIDIAAPSTWTAAWRHILCNAMGLSLADRKWLYTTAKQSFDHAVLDFIQLQQIDYNAAFHCDCFTGEDHRVWLCIVQSLFLQQSVSTLACMQRASPWTA